MSLLIILIILIINFDPFIIHLINYILFIFMKFIISNFIKPIFNFINIGYFIINHFINSKFHYFIIYSHFQHSINLFNVFTVMNLYFSYYFINSLLFISFLIKYFRFLNSQVIFDYYLSLSK